MNPEILALLAQFLNAQAPVPRPELARPSLPPPALPFVREATPIPGFGAGAGPGSSGAIMAALQDPNIQQMIMSALQPQQQDQASVLAPPGLLMPDVQIQPYAPPALSALAGLFGG